MMSFSFPPVYTLQSSNRLLQMQLNFWSQEIFKKAAQLNDFKIQKDSPFFVNKQLKRVADPELKKAIFEYLCKKQSCVDKGDYYLLLSENQIKTAMLTAIKDKGQSDEFHDFDTFWECFEDTPVYSIGEEYCEELLDEFVKEKKALKSTDAGYPAWKFMLNK